MRVTVLIHVKCSARRLAHSRCSINGSSYSSEGTKGRVSKGRTLAAGLLGSFIGRCGASLTSTAQVDCPSSSGPLLWLGEALVLGGREWKSWKQNFIPESSGPMTALHHSDFPSPTLLPWTPAQPWERLGLGGFLWPSV